MSANWGRRPTHGASNIFYVFTRALDFERRTYRGSSLVSSQRTFRRHLDAKTKVNVCEQWKMSCRVSAFWPRLAHGCMPLYSGMREHNKFELFHGKWSRRHQTALRQRYVTTQAVKYAHYTSERCHNMRGLGAGRNMHPQTFQLQDPPWSKTRTIFQLATRDKTHFISEERKSYLASW